ncbi:hypothetical protein EDEG_02296 [Edhazardia aedis USNM 41457]|uniref:Uncharacterized protein n=1 Tax=Edhazardia aedis (strain USNM 41457) TaxID=1003232 RepID=J9D753_EDHAE|nr:hypothetical protein EDEG_02296 [Edhazardia aedis USNM 41457]|eukprot:EJW03364.1 hypothetical protein EDEG_02296 [Edhazardia aedis USNM 41457]
MCKKAYMEQLTKQNIHKFFENPDKFKNLLETNKAEAKESEYRCKNVNKCAYHNSSLLSDLSDISVIQSAYSCKYRFTKSRRMLINNHILDYFADLLSPQGENFLRIEKIFGKEYGKILNYLKCIEEKITMPNEMIRKRLEYDCYDNRVFTFHIDTDSCQMEHLFNVDVNELKEFIHDTNSMVGMAEEKALARERLAQTKARLAAEAKAKEDAEAAINATENAISAPVAEPEQPIEDSQVERFEVSDDSNLKDGEKEDYISSELSEKSSDEKQKNNNTEIPKEENKIDRPGMEIFDEFLTEGNLQDQSEAIRAQLIKDGIIDGSPESNIPLPTHEQCARLISYRWKLYRYYTEPLQQMNQTIPQPDPDIAHFNLKYLPYFIDELMHEGIPRAVREYRKACRRAEQARLYENLYTIPPLCPTHQKQYIDRFETHMERSSRLVDKEIPYAGPSLIEKVFRFMNKNIFKCYVRNQNDIADE